jgi:hypothetical protein
VNREREEHYRLLLDKLKVLYIDLKNNSNQIGKHLEDVLILANAFQNENFIKKFSIEQANEISSKLNEIQKIGDEIIKKVNEIAQKH